MVDKNSDFLNMNNYRIEKLPVRSKSKFETRLQQIGSPLALLAFVIIYFFLDISFLQNINPEKLTESAKVVFNRIGAEHFSHSNVALLAIFAAALVLWITEAIPNYLTSLMLIIALVLTKVLPEKDLTFNVKVDYSNGDVEEVKFYYIINYDAATYVEDNDRKSFEWAGALPTSDKMYNFAIAAAELNAGDKVIWYMRAKDGAGDKQYFTKGKDASFDKDVISDWNEVSIDGVVTNGFSELAIGGGTSTVDLTFDVKVEYSNGDVNEVKFYYIINYDAATYVEDNDRKSFEWAGALPTSDKMYNFAVPAAELNAGDKVIWYMRAKDGAGDKQYFTEGKDETFDKDVITDWNEVSIN